MLGSRLAASGSGDWLRLSRGSGPQSGTRARLRVLSPRSLLQSLPAPQHFPGLVTLTLQGPLTFESSVWVV